MRPDGTRVKNASAIVSALPYIMPRRYDAHDYITEYAEMEPMRRYIQSKRREGVRISYMALILAAYFKAYQQNPKINRFIMNKQVFARNTINASLTVLRNAKDKNNLDEALIKMTFKPDATIDEVAEQINAGKK